ncbi:hypothetical protein CYMTET_11719, partial [Cymbomonas tetramitiformis]
RALYGARYSKAYGATAGPIEPSYAEKAQAYIQQRSTWIMQAVQNVIPDSDMWELLQPLYKEMEAGLRAVWDLHTLSRAFEVPPEIIRCHVGALCSDASVELVDDSYVNVTHVASWKDQGKV